MAKKAKSSGSVVNLDRYDYERSSIRDASGKVRHSASNGDAIAKAMLLLHTGKQTIAGVVRANGLTAKFKDRDPEKNPGLFRMSVGVALRALVNHGTPVTIGDVVVKSLKQTVALPKVEKTERAPTKPKATKKAKKAAKPRKARAAAAEAAQTEQSAA